MILVNFYFEKYMYSEIKNFWLFFTNNYKEMESYTLN